jgi:hypothetical protein
MRAQAAPSSSATSSPLASLKAARRALALALLRLSVITAGGDHTGLFEGGVSKPALRARASSEKAQALSIVVSNPATVDKGRFSEIEIVLVEFGGLGVMLVFRTSFTPHDSLRWFLAPPSYSLRPSPSGTACAIRARRAAATRCGERVARDARQWMSLGTNRLETLQADRCRTSPMCGATFPRENVAPDRRQVRHASPCMSLRIVAKCDMRAPACRSGSSRSETFEPLLVARRAREGRHGGASMSPDPRVPCDMRRRPCRVTRSPRATWATVHVALLARPERHGPRCTSLDPRGQLSLHGPEERHVRPPRSIHATAERDVDRAGIWMHQAWPATSSVPHAP